MRGRWESRFAFGLRRGYQALGVYVLLSAASSATALILLTTALTLVTTLICGVAVVGFIGGVGTIMAAFLIAFFGGRRNSTR